MGQRVDSPLSDVECTSSSRGVIMPHVVSPEVVDGEVTTPQIALSGERMEGEKRSRTNGSKIFGWVIGFSCLTTLGLVFVAYKYIYLGLLRDGYTASQCVGFWINVLLVIPFVFIGVLLRLWVSSGLYVFFVLVCVRYGKRRIMGIQRVQILLTR